MPSVMLSTLAAELGLRSSGDAALTGLAIDSREVCPGDLFVAIRGAALDGRDFIDSALARGATAVLSESEVSQAVPFLRVDDPQLACAAFGSLMRRAFSGSVIGITGSVGKTTAKSFISNICSLAGTTVSTLGNQNNELGVPLTLGRLSTDPDFAVVEMGAAQQGDIAFLNAMARPKVAVLLNALDAHIGRFGNLQAIVDTKGEIVDGLSEDSTAVICADQPYFEQWKARAKPATVLSFGRSEAAQFRLIEVISRGFDGSDAVFEIYGERHRVHLAVPGQAGIMNALAAAAVGHALGIDTALIIEGIAQLRPVSGRGNTVHLARGVRLIDESYNASPSSVMAAVSVLGEAESPRTVILGDMLELGEDSVTYHRTVGKQVSDLGIERLISVGPLAYEATLACDSDTAHFSDAEDLIAGDTAFAKNETILVKGSRGVHLERFVHALSSSLAEVAC